MLTRYAMTGVDDMLREFWAIAFESIRLDFTHYKADGTIDKVSRAAYDIPKAQRTL